MRYYVLDDNLATAKSLVNIIKVKGIGEVCGYALDPQDALEDIPRARPDIVLVDLLMDGMDGITFVQTVRERNPEICFVMVSKVTDKDMIAQAYEAGVEFFVSKPVNIVEIERVLTNVAEKLRMKGIVDNIRGMFEAPSSDTKSTTPIPESRNSSHDLDILFSKLGMLGEKGTSDIRALFRYMEDHQIGYSRDVLDSVAGDLNETPKNVEQRIRRAMKKGLNNAAHIGLDDFSNETFAVYADYVFDFKTLKNEMNGIETGTSGGRVSISKFMDGLLLYRSSLK